MHIPYLPISLITATCCMQLITKPEVEESGVHSLLEKSGIFPSLPAQDQKKTKDVEQHYSQGRENNSLISNSKQKSNIFCRCELPEVDSHRYLFSQLINDSLLLKDLTHMKRLQLLKAWSKNPGNHPRYCTKEQIEKINIKSKSLKHLLEKSKQKIYLLIDFRLLELGALHSSSNNQRMLASFASKEYRGEKFSPAGRFFLRTLDFLNRQKLIISSSHMKKLWDGIESITKHWYWSMMLEEYTVSSEMDEGFLTLNYLSEGQSQPIPALI
ncbi:hypothetical protein PGTUg99_014090 [Puccinia graminis f. sp. tritici]|uniref:Uncharacterized protein n=1 Tax=Puccinia graminis f. sp. tritici TaxID=56615 RepID=A0A5B0S5P6_PUCGR|nr:hypothetical protein PGTUg99_014090 [Puccinia graminis f. sp. tritici]